MSKPSKVLSFFNGLTEEEKLEMSILLAQTAFDGNKIVLSRFSQEEYDLNTFEGQQALGSQGFEMKFGMAAGNPDEDGFVQFLPVLVAKKGEEKFRFEGVRKAEPTIQNLSAGKGRLGLAEIGQIWKMKDSGMEMAAIATALGRKVETVFSTLQKDRPTSI